MPRPAVPSLLRLRTLGGAALLRDGVPLEGRAVQRRKLALLAVFASAGNRGISREALAALFWPDSDEASARHALSQWLFLLRRDLDIPDLVTGSADLRLNPDRMVTDVAEFDAAVARGDHEAAAALYAGPFLDGFAMSEGGEFEHWMERERAQRLHRAVTSIGCAARALEARDPAGALAMWRRLAAIEPLSDPAALGILRLLDAGGDHAGALVHARHHEQTLQREFDVAPSAEFAAAVARVRRKSAAAAAVATTETSIITRAAQGEPYVEFVRERLRTRARIDRVVAQTSLVTIFDAASIGDDALLTVKVVLPDVLARSDADRLARGLAAAARIVHPRLAPVDAVWHMGGLTCAIGPRLTTHTLRERLDADRRLSIGLALDIAIAAATALAHAEQHAIPHLDLTPRRILLAGGGPQVADLGLMHAVLQAIRHSPIDSGLALGTPAYMSPEQLEGDTTLGSVSDVYSLGCVLFEMIAGEPPHSAGNARALIARRVREPANTVGELREDVPEPVGTAIARMLSRAIADRPQSAAEALAVLATLRKSVK